MRELLPYAVIVLAVVDATLWGCILGCLDFLAGEVPADADWRSLL